MIESRRWRALDARRSIPLGMLISNIGNGMYLLAVSVILYRSSGSSTMFAWLLVYQAVAVLAMQLFASVGADRGHAQRLAVAAELTRALIVALGAFGASTGYSSVLVLCGVLLSLVQPFFRTSIFKIGPLIADGEDLAKYNARTSTFQQLGQFLGAAAAGGLMSVWLVLPLWINAISYLASAFFTAVCLIPDQVPAARWRVFFPQLFHPRRALTDWWEGMRYVVRSPLVLGVCVFAAVDLIFINVINVSYAPMLRALELSNTWISTWDVCFAIGAIIGVNVFGRTVLLHNRWPVLALCLTAEAGLSAYLIVRSPVTIAGVMVLVGTANSLSTSAFAFYLQTHGSKEMIGRIAGVRQLCTTVLSAALMGWLSSGVDEALLIGWERTATMLIAAALGVTALFLTTARRESAHLLRNRQ